MSRKRVVIAMSGGVDSSVSAWSTSPTANEFRAECRIRYRHQPAPCRGGLADNRFVVNFDTPQTSVTPGQAAVLYDGERVLGGGWIE